MADDIDLTEATLLLARRLYDHEVPEFDGNDDRWNRTLAIGAADHHLRRARRYLELVAPLLIEQITKQVRAECWDDCTEANPCGYCQHGQRQGRRLAARGIRAHAAGLEEWARLDYEHAARIAEGNTDRG